MTACVEGSLACALPLDVVACMEIMRVVGKLSLIQACRECMPYYCTGVQQ